MPTPTQVYPLGIFDMYNKTCMKKFMIYSSDMPYGKVAIFLIFICPLLTE